MAILTVFLMVELISSALTTTIRSFIAPSLRMSTLRRTRPTSTFKFLALGANSGIVVYRKRIERNINRTVGSGELIQGVPFVVVIEIMDIVQTLVSFYFWIDAGDKAIVAVIQIVTAPVKQTLIPLRL